MNDGGVTRIDIRPMSPGAPQRVEAEQKARALGRGVRMELHSSHTEFYADRHVEVGKIAIYVPHEYKGWPEYETTLESPQDPWESPLERSMREHAEAHEAAILDALKSAFYEDAVAGDTYYATALAGLRSRGFNVVRQSPDLPTTEPITKEQSMTTETQQKHEVTLYNTVEALLNEKHAATAWNYSTTADEVVDAVVAAGWVHESDVQAWLAEQYGEHASEAFADAFVSSLPSDGVPQDRPAGVEE